ncbi:MULTISPECIES: hypothetical protein [unclassified Streptomyces]|uniref:hypothetical protein n=1 Tax=unclassified Streptomyces TaxID=2593676 RepID=UPI002E15E967|nr:hypothetical protein OG573_28895 [Streptomyces sp. NBC_01205]
MTREAVTVARRAAVAGLLCAVLAACGTRHAGEAAAPPAPVKETCGLDRTTGGGTGLPDPPTEEQGGANAGPPTDEETGGYAGPPTDQETGGYAGPPTDEETGGYAGPPTDQDTGAPDPPTDGDITNGAGPCGGAGWFDMTRDFNAYYARQRTDSDQFLPEQAVREARVRKGRDAGEALVTFTTRSVGKGLGEDARRVAQVFVAWRQQVYGDRGTVSVRTPEGEVVASAAW